MTEANTRDIGTETHVYAKRAFRKVQVYGTKLAVT